jgi:methylmalonyl-CoA epimerase
MPNPANEDHALAKYAQRIDHLGIAVRDLEESLRFFTQVLGFCLVQRRETVGKRTGMISAELKAGPISVVLLQGTSPDSQVSAFIDHYGPGVQHVAIAVDNIEASVEHLRNNGLCFDTSIVGDDNLKQIFSSRDAKSGLMIELIQRTTSGFADKNVSKLFEELESHGSF